MLFNGFAGQEWLKAVLNNPGNAFNSRLDTPADEYARRLKLHDSQSDGRLDASLKNQYDHAANAFRRRA